MRSGPRVIAWADQRAASVRNLVVQGAAYGPHGQLFTRAHLAGLVEVLAPHLTMMQVEFGDRWTLLDPPFFWESLRAAGRLRWLILELGAIHRGLTAWDLEPLRGLTSLETLQLRASEVCGSDDESSEPRFLPGLARFPDALLALTGLRELVLDNHWVLREVPEGISSLRNLETLDISNSWVRSLPDEINALSNLRELVLQGIIGPDADLRGDEGGGHGQEFSLPDELGGMTSLTRLSLKSCGIHVVPSGVLTLKSLKVLDLEFNRLGGRGKRPEGGRRGGGRGGGGRGRAERTRELSELSFPASREELPALETLELSDCGLTAVPQAVLSSMPGLRVLHLGDNGLKELPRDFGKSLPRLERLWLCGNRFAGVPRGLEGAKALEVLERLELFFSLF